MYQIVKVFYDNIGKHRDTLCRNVQTIEASLPFFIIIFFFLEIIRIQCTWRPSTDNESYLFRCQCKFTYIFYFCTI